MVLLCTIVHLYGKNRLNVLQAFKKTNTHDADSSLQEKEEAQSKEDKEERSVIALACDAKNSAMESLKVSPKVRHWIPPY